MRREMYGVDVHADPGIVRGANDARGETTTYVGCTPARGVARHRLDRGIDHQGARGPIEAGPLRAKPRKAMSGRRWDAAPYPPGPPHRAGRRDTVPAVSLPVLAD